MRLQMEMKLTLYQRVYQRQQLESRALSKELLREALFEAELHAPPRLVEEALMRCVSEQGQVSKGISFDTWVKAAEQSRKLIPVENRKQANFSDAELEQLRSLASLFHALSNFISLLS